MPSLLRSLLASRIPAVAGVPDGPAGLDADAVAAVTAQKSRLNFAKPCYICKNPFRDLHGFYAALCPVCAELNWRKRDEVCDLTGRVALVTGD